MKQSHTFLTILAITVATIVATPSFIAHAQTATPSMQTATPSIAKLAMTSRTVKPLQLGNAAWVVSEVTVKKVVDTRELARIREVLKETDAATWRLDTVANGKRTIAGTLPLNAFVLVDKTTSASSLGRAASVVSEVTVKKVVDTRELDRIREVLRSLNSRDASVHAVRVEELPVM